MEHEIVTWKYAMRHGYGPTGNTVQIGDEVLAEWRNIKGRTVWIVLVGDEK